MLDDQSALQIHAASLDLLDSPGVRIEHEGIIELLLRAGASHGIGAQVVRFPRALVMESVALAPSQVLLANRRQSGRRLAPGGASQIWTAPGLNIVRHGEHRRLVRPDLAMMARLVEQLDSVDGIVGVALADVPPRAGDFVGLRTMAANTRKHVRVLSTTPEGAEAVAQMRDVGGSGPWVSMGFTAHGPLRWTHLALEVFARSAGKGIPVTINGEPMAGASGPVTLAGAAAVGNAEILAGLVVNQVLEPGRPCIYNLGLAHVLDMRAAVAVTGGPENHLLADISAAMGRLYDLPSASWVSTESMVADSQAALEKAMGFLSHLHSQVSLIWGVGQLESELSWSPAQAVIDDEAIRYARRLLAGVCVSTESLALDVVRQVGIAGEFLSHPHTLEHFRRELFEPAVLFRGRREAWHQAGSRSLAQVAEERADALVAAAAPDALSDAEGAEMGRIETAFLERLAR
jgi:trimethylamine---corrinoid protein Co-methyltransferase